MLDSGHIAFFSTIPDLHTPSSPYPPDPNIYYTTKVSKVNLSGIIAYKNWQKSAMREHILNFDFASQRYKYFTTIDMKTLKDLTT